MWKEFLLPLLLLGFASAIQFEKEKYEFLKSHAAAVAKYMDFTVQPCEDFYNYTCGRWHLFNPIPDGHSGYNSIAKLSDETDNVIKALLENKDGVSGEEGDALSKVIRLYNTCLNIDAISARGSKPLLSLIKSFGGWPAIDEKWSSKNFDWIAFAAKARQLGQAVFFSSAVMEDIRNTKENVFYIDNPTLALGSRDFYFTGKKQLIAYTNLLDNVLKQFGVNDDMKRKQEVSDIVNFEIALANITEPAGAQQFGDRYARMTLQEAMQKYPVDWVKYFSLVHGIEVDPSHPVVVMGTKLQSHLPELIKHSNPRTIANYVVWRVIVKMLPLLGNTFGDVLNKFNKEILGVDIKVPRWKVCLKYATTSMDHAVLALFVQKNFNSAAKTQIETVFDYLTAVFRLSLHQTQWLKDSDREAALKKLDAMKIELGIPEFVNNSTQLNEQYEHLNISGTDFFENTLNVIQFDNYKQSIKIGKPADASEWKLPLSAPMGFYEFTQQRVLITVPFLQLPFYHKHFPQFINFGRLGTVIGHEISHGFDVAGAQFDANGMMRPWWSQEAFDTFKGKAQCFIDQYNKYDVNGHQVQAEAMADTAGLKLAFHAYQLWKNKYADILSIIQEDLPGFIFTREQLFFISFAQLWCDSMLPHGIANQIKFDTHPPNRFRVNGVVSNSEEFAQTFFCPKGTKMNPVEKCNMW